VALTASFDDFRRVCGRSSNDQKTSTLASEKVEKLWGTGVARHRLAARECESFWGSSPVRAPNQAEMGPSAPAVAGKRAQFPKFTHRDPQKLSTSAGRTPCPLRQNPKSSPPLAHIHSSFARKWLPEQGKFLTQLFNPYKCLLSNFQGQLHGSL